MMQKFHLGIYTHKINSRDSTRHLYSHAHDSITHKSQKVEGPKSSRVNVTWYRKSMAPYPAIKQKEIVTHRAEEP